MKAGAADLHVEVEDGVVVGRVLGSTGLGVAHAVVVAHLANGEVLEVETGEHGTFALWNLPPGPARVEVAEPFGRAAVAVDVVEGERRELTITLE